MKILLGIIGGILFFSGVIFYVESRNSWPRSEIHAQRGHITIVIGYDPKMDAIRKSASVMSGDPKESIERGRD